MISGIGIDLIEIDRVLKACEKESFLTRIYTEKEMELIKADRVKAAGNFAVKEAVAKVFASGFRAFRPIDIEVLRDDLGRPYVNLHGKAKALAKEQGIVRIHVSISYSKDYSNAFAVGEKGI